MRQFDRITGASAYITMGMQPPIWVSFGDVVKQLGGSKIYFHHIQGFGHFVAPGK